jgi:GTP cyclohydrolase II
MRALLNLVAYPYFGFGSGTNKKSARLTSITQALDRSRNPNVNTHSQVPTTDVLHYTACDSRPNYTTLQ